METKTDYAIFPLPLFILPGGRQRLRIFEQKYLTMVAHAAQGDGFVIASHDNRNNSPIKDWGTKVKIVDFNLSDDKLLEIDVEGESLVRLFNTRRDDTGLLKADFETLPHWPTLDCQLPPVFSNFLVQLFREHDAIRELYPHTNFEDPQWICARLLEVMPLPIEKKVRFTSPSSFPALVPFLNQIITGND